jgi:hypothetical protein
MVRAVWVMVGAGGAVLRPHDDGIELAGLDLRQERVPLLAGLLGIRLATPTSAPMPSTAV